MQDDGHYPPPHGDVVKIFAQRSFVPQGDAVPFASKLCRRSIGKQHHERTMYSLSMCTWVTDVKPVGPVRHYRHENAVLDYPEPLETGAGDCGCDSARDEWIGAAATLIEDPRASHSPYRADDAN